MAFGFGILGKIFGSEKAMEKTVDAGISALDKLFYTKEEKSEDAAKRAEADRAERVKLAGILVEWLNTSKGQNLARRFLAFAIAGTWLAQYWFIMVASVSAVWAETKMTVDKLEQSVDVISSTADGMTGAMMLILGFYFAAPHIGSIVQGAMQRFGGTIKT